ncbi:MAG: hypothetical protein WC359_13590 [Dehalococcoidia bacterium]|jgi:hypothetical protein
MPTTAIQLLISPQPVIKGQEFILSATLMSWGQLLASATIRFSYAHESNPAQRAQLGSIVTNGEGIADGYFILNLGGNYVFYATFDGSGEFEASETSVTADLICGDCVTGDVIHETCWNGEVIPYKVCGGDTCWHDSDLFTCEPRPVQPYVYLIAAGAAALALGMVLK